ncbi:hypothetical protein BD410DRAFT_874053 [Rickenella mellea]|uniref:Uncharacterized protein n=1 Tax=Rickenella mellea TaxID=50990 RepID=A0A4Y7PWF5_9AGAM|nr:hypothetical protein BD410DRAFT_874053 [Rickenella mellea]
MSLNMPQAFISPLDELEDVAEQDEFPRYQPKSWRMNTKEVRIYAIKAAEGCRDPFVKKVAYHLGLSLALFLIEQAMRRAGGLDEETSSFHLLDCNGERVVLEVFYHTNKVTLTDVFNALGFLIAMTDTPAGCLENIKWLVYTIMTTTEEWMNTGGLRAARLLPTCTTIIFSIYHRPYYAVDLRQLQVQSSITPQVPATPIPMVSLGSGIPGRPGDYKEVNRQLRESDVRNYDPKLPDALESHRLSQARPLPQKLGHCSETLPLLSQSMPDRWGYVFGTTLALTYNTQINPLIQSSYMEMSAAKWEAWIAPPCDNCVFAIPHLNLTYIDFGKLVPCHPDMWLQAYGSGRKSALTDKRVICKNCPAAWCSQKHYESDLTDSYPHKCFDHAAELSFPRLLAERLSGSGKVVYGPYRPEVIGRPPRPRTAPPFPVQETSKIGPWPMSVGVPTNSSFFKFT